jgi:hypothetical protein
LRPGRVVMRRLMAEIAIDWQELVYAAQRAE